MQNTLSHFTLLIKRWWWLVALGIVLCSGTTYVISKLIHPVYQATAILIVNFQTSPSSYDSVSASLQAVPTYAQLLQSPAVLGPVLALHPGMTLKDLTAMITVTPKPNSQLIELDVDNTNPTLAMNIANEISNQFVQFVNPQLSASVLPVYATRPTSPIRPRPLQDAGIGALVGLGLALALIFLFEWIDDRLASPEEVQDLLGMETLTIIPRLSRRELIKKAEEVPALAEACRMLCASLNAAQALRPFKLVMVTSALAGEGKSTVAANLASFLALAGKRVLLVDADLRRPVQYRHFQLDNSRGLSHALVPTSSLVDQLFDYFMKAPFDYILFDTPPLLPVADAQALASHIQVTVVVVDASKTPRKILLRVKSVFNRTDTKILGVAINKCSWPEYGYIREYQRYIRQSKTKGVTTSSRDALPAGNEIDTTTPGPSVARVADVPTSEADPNITIILPRANAIQQKPRDNK